jgi:hypothetical protein
MNLNLHPVARTESRIAAAGRAFGAMGEQGGNGLAAAAAPPGALVRAQAS